MRDFQVTSTEITERTWFGVRAVNERDAVKKALAKTPDQVERTISENAIGDREIKPRVGFKGRK